MTRGARCRGTVEEEVLAAPRIACRDLHRILADAGDLVDASQQGDGIVQERITGIDGGSGQLVHHGLDRRDGGKFQELHKRGLACDEIRILDRRAAEEQLLAGLVGGQGTNGVAPE